MDSFKVAIAGDRQVGVRLDAFGDGLYDALRAEIDALTVELYTRVRAATPQRSGKLLSDERMKVFADPNRIKGSVTVVGAHAKAGALEYGAHRATTVRAHRMRLDHAWDQALAEPLNVLVSAYTRTPDIQEHRFERGPLAEMQPEIAARLNAAVQKAVATANA